MAKNNLALTALFLGAAALACAASPQSSSDKAKALLAKTLDRNYAHNVIAIISQRSPENHGTYQRIQVQISKDGKMRQTVIYPLSLQGVETIDDGKQSATFLPDERVTLIQESPRLLPNDTFARINLTNTNYVLRLAGTSQVAGRKAQIVVASPRSKDMEIRRFHIDEITGFLLQLETIQADGEMKVAFKALQVQYPAKLKSSTFDINLDSRDGQKLIFRRRVDLFGGNKGTASIGFEPTLPPSLPCGFSMQDAQINDGGSYRSVAVRITDGLVKATVYQYSQSIAANLKANNGTTIGDSAGIRFVVAADVPEAVRRKILIAFLEAARKSIVANSRVGLSDSAELWPDCGSLLQAQLYGILLDQVARSEAIPLSE